MKWEYRFLNLPYPIQSDTNKFNELGDQGWELVQIIEASFVAVFKRSKIAPEPVIAPESEFDSLSLLKGETST